MNPGLVIAFLAAISCVAKAEAPAGVDVAAMMRDAQAKWDARKAAIVPEIREVTTAARFQEKEGVTYLIIREGIFYLDLPWISRPAAPDRPAQPYHFYPATLEAGKTYRFTFEEKRHLYDEGLAVPTTFPFYRPQFYDTQLVRIASGDTVLYDREVCAVHHCKMARVEVPILYGLAPHLGKVPPPDLSRTFPNYEEFARGGCCIITGPGVSVTKTELKYVCPECKRAYTVWAAAQPPDARDRAR